MTIETLTYGAVFTKTWRDTHTIVNIESDGDLGLFFCSMTNGVITASDRAPFETTAERNEALNSVIAEFVAGGYERVS